MAVVTYLLTRQRTRLAFSYAGDRLLGLSGEGLPKDITVQYQGQPIPRLTRTLVVVWNDGERTILGKDVVESDPLRLRVEDAGSVLAATILKSSRHVCQLQVNLPIDNSHQVDLSFEFLDADDGAVIEVLHTSEKRATQLQGTIRGLPKGLTNLGRIKAMPRTWRSFPRILSSRMIGIVILIIGLLLLNYALMVPWDTLTRSAESVYPVRWIVAITGTLYVFSGFVILFLTRRRYPKSLHLEGLE